MYYRWNPLCNKWSESAASRSSMLISEAGSGTYFLYLMNFIGCDSPRVLVVRPALAAEFAFFVLVADVLLFALWLLFASSEQALFATTDALVSV